MVNAPSTEHEGEDYADGGTTDGTLTAVNTIKITGTKMSIVIALTRTLQTMASKMCTISNTLSLLTTIHLRTCVCATCVPMVRELACHVSMSCSLFQNPGAPARSIQMIGRLVVHNQDWCDPLPEHLVDHSFTKRPHRRLAQLPCFI